MPTHEARLRKLAEKIASATMEVQEVSHLFRDEVNEIRKEERWRISRRLHDKSAQDLVAASLSVSSLRQLCHDCPVHDSTQQLLDLSELMSKVLKEVRCLSFLFNPVDIREHGFVAAVRKALSDFAHENGYQPDLFVRMGANEIPDEIGAVLFVIIEEVLSATHNGDFIDNLSLFLIQTRGVVRLVFVTKFEEPKKYKSLNLPPRAVVLSSINEYAHDLGGNVAQTTGLLAHRIAVTIPLQEADTTVLSGASARQSDACEAS